jgi:5-methylcytosine-specific restriction enzyme A
VAVYAALKRARGPARAAGLRLYGMKTMANRRSLWDADHILPVCEGGGQCDLDNIRTLCLLCHREATRVLRSRLRLKREIAESY